MVWLFWRAFQAEELASLQANYYCRHAGNPGLHNKGRLSVKEDQPTDHQFKLADA